MERPTRYAKLTETFCKQTRKPGIYGDGYGGHGLYFRVRETKSGKKSGTGRGLSKRFYQKVKIGAKRTNIAIGPYPVITLAEARTRVLRNARIIESGKDPRAAPTFEKASAQVLKLHRDSWKPGSTSESQWKSHMARYVFPILGDRKVDEITAADIGKVIQPLWTDKPRVADKVLARIRAVMRWAIAEGFLELPRYDGHLSLWANQGGESWREAEGGIRPSTRSRLSSL